MENKTIVTVHTERLARLLIQNLFNLQGVKATYFMNTIRDTDYSYTITCEDQKLTKGKWNDVRQFAAGFVAAWNAI